MSSIYYTTELFKNSIIKAMNVHQCRYSIHPDAPLYDYGYGVGARRCTEPKNLPGKSHIMYMTGSLTGLELDQEG